MKVSLVADWADVGRPACQAAGRLVETVRARFGQAGVLVHNAGITRDKTMKKMSEEQWAAVMRVNLQAILSINEAAGLHGAEPLLRPGGSVVWTLWHLRGGGFVDESCAMVLAIALPRCAPSLFKVGCLMFDP